jgi:hypothetical protein
VAVAALLKPEVMLPVLIVMGIAWFVTMNVISPRLMSSAIGIHPIVVLASVIIGSKIAGIAGAIFGIPIAAVLSAFFFHGSAGQEGGRSPTGQPGACSPRGCQSGTRGAVQASTRTWTESAVDAAGLAGPPPLRCLARAYAGGYR